MTETTKTTTERWISTLSHLLPPVLTSVAIAVAGLFIVRALVPSSALVPSNDAVASYLQTLGSIYAVLLAFVVYVVWGQFNEARACVEREASNLTDLLWTARALGQVGVDLRKLAGEYVDAVLSREWPALAGGHEQDPVVDGVSAILERMGQVLLACRPEDETQGTWFGEALGCFNDLSDSRTNRLSNSRLRIPLAMRLLLNMGAAMTVGSLYLLAVADPWIHAIMTAALAGAVSHVLYVVRDLDNCFVGDWQAPKTPFERVQRQISPLRGASS